MVLEQVGGTEAPIFAAAGALVSWSVGQFKPTSATGRRHQPHGGPEARRAPASVRLAQGGGPGERCRPSPPYGSEIRLDVRGDRPAS
jgi:hypothetical protein